VGSSQSRCTHSARLRAAASTHFACLESTEGLSTAEGPVRGSRVAASHGPPSVRSGPELKDHRGIRYRLAASHRTGKSHGLSVS